MVIQNKTYMNFLGGEVSPEAYKRLDMAGNNKWFETAKNIWFGTTGDFYNRNGFQYIGKVGTEGTPGERVKLIPFIYNRRESFCIAFYSSTFSVLKNGDFIRDALGHQLFFEHPGLSLNVIDDLSYAQIADVLYFCSGGTNKIFTISRYSDTDWRWAEFVYEIPPMRDTNEDPAKTLTFTANPSFSYVGYYPVRVNVAGTFVTPSIDIMHEGQWVNIYTSNSVFYSLTALVADFNVNQTGSTYVKNASASSDEMRIYLQEDGPSVDQVRLTCAAGSSSFKYYNYGEELPEYNHVAGISDRRYSYPVPASERVRQIDVRYGTYKYAFFSSSTKRWENELTKVFVPAATGTEVATAVNTQINQGDLLTYDTDEEAFIAHLMSSDGTAYYGGNSKGLSITSIITEVYSDEAVIYYSAPFVGETSLDVITSSYNVSASFDFFEDKEVGEVFAVESLFSPSKDGKEGENKSFSQTDIQAGSFTTPSFWSNGNWRVVTSGLFEGTIELQYSYDGTNWYSHRTFSSSIRTQQNVSYSTNYNEYGSIEVDDNVLLRLQFDVTTATNLAVTLDGESFKNRSYYEILEKTGTGLRTAIVRCIKYPVGTPGLFKYESSTQEYQVNPVYEWAEAAWSHSNGMPKYVFFYQNRLAFCNTTRDNSIIWFSKTNNFKDFSTKIDYSDDDPITLMAVRPTGISEITGVASSRKLFIFTADHEEAIADEGALTQANKQLINFTSYGSEPLEVRNVSNRIIFVERGGHAARALIYDFGQDNYEAPDLTLPYKHLLTNEKITGTEFIAGDSKTYLMMTSAGRVLAFKYVPEQKIEACSWLRHAKGDITNVCVVNTPTGFLFYIVVDNGKFKQIEYMPIEMSSSGIYLDSFRSYSFDSATNTITDADYFVPGVEYTVISGTNRYKATAGSDGSITLPEMIEDCVVGIGYVSEATLIPANLMFQNGTTNYNQRNPVKAFITYFDSALFKVGIKKRDRSFRQVFNLDGDHETDIENLHSDSRNFVLQSSYFDDNMLSMVQEEPAPMHITNAEVSIDYGGR